MALAVVYFQIFLLRFYETNIVSILYTLKDFNANFNTIENSLSSFFIFLLSWRFTAYASLYEDNWDNRDQKKKSKSMSR